MKISRRSLVADRSSSESTIRPTYPVVDPLRRSPQCCELSRPANDQRLSTNDLLHPRKLHPRHSPRETRLAHLLEHFSHLRVLSKQVIDFLHARSRAASDAFASAAVDRLV